MPPTKTPRDEALKWINRYIETEELCSQSYFLVHKKHDDRPILEILRTIRAALSEQPAPIEGLDWELQKLINVRDAMPTKNFTPQQFREWENRKASALHIFWQYAVGKKSPLRRLYAQSRTQETPAIPPPTCPKIDKALAFIAALLEEIRAENAQLRYGHDCMKTLLDETRSAAPPVAARLTVEMLEGMKMVPFDQPETNRHYGHNATALTEVQKRIRGTE